MSQLIIEVTQAETKTRNVNSKKNPGQVLTFYEQEVWLHNGHQYPERARVTLPRDVTTPYPVGKYILSPDSFYVGNYGDIQCSPRLQALTGASSKAA